MIRSIKKFWRKLETAAAENRRREAEKQQMLRDNLATWNDMNRTFIKEMDRETDREIEQKYDVAKASEPDAYTFDGSPLNH